MTPKEYLIAWCNDAGIATNDKSLIHELRENSLELRLDIDERRHWYTYRDVSKIGDKYIMYVWAGTTTDYSPSEAGWEFNWNSVCFAKQVTRTVTSYEIINKGE